MELYLRKVMLTASGSGAGLKINQPQLTDHDLKIEFNVSKTLSSTQNSASIKIWNLAEAHRNAIGKELDDITLEAGYIGNTGVIFKGQIRDVQHTRQDSDIITELSCGDGDRAFRKAVISKTFPKGTKVEDVMNEVYTQLSKEGIQKGEWKFPENTTEFKRPYSLCGTCKREADTLGRGKGFYWSVQNETMEVIPSDGYIGTMIVFSPESGLLDVPTITDNGVKIRVLLNPEVRPNRRIRVISQVLEMNAENGDFRVGECTFSGDNRSGKFEVAITGESIKGGKVDEGVYKDKLK